MKNTCILVHMEEIPVIIDTPPSTARKHVACTAWHENRDDPYDGVSDRIDISPLYIRVDCARKFQFSKKTKNQKTRKERSP